MKLPFIRLTDPVYRGHNPRWSFAAESGEGAKRYGGRFNPKGVPALYTSRRPETAWLEGQQSLPFKAQPLTLRAYAVDCMHILDLTDPDTRQAARTSLNELGCAWEYFVARGETPPSWRFATDMIENYCAGIVVPSFAAGAADRDINIVFWNWSADPPHQVRVIDDEDRLPSNDRSMTSSLARNNILNQAELKSVDPVGREVDAGRIAGDQLGNQLAGNGPLGEAEMTMAEGVIEPLVMRRSADHRQ